MDWKGKLLATVVGAVVLLVVLVSVAGCKTTLREMVDLHGQMLTQTADYQERTGTEVVGTAVLDGNTQVALVEGVAVTNPSRITLTFLSKGEKAD